MGKLKRGFLHKKILLKKKDYILKGLPAQRGLSHSETMEYIRIHLPSLYPGEINPGQLGYARQGKQLLVFILHTPMQKSDRSRAVVPFLLWDEEKALDTKDTGNLLLTYRDGYENILFENGEVTGVDWEPRNSGDYADDSMYSGTFTRQLIIEKEAGEERVSEDQPLEMQDRTLRKIFGSSKSSISRANPFIHPPLFSKGRIIRMGTALMISIVMLILIYLRIAEAQNSRIELLEERLAGLTQRAYALTSQQQESAEIDARLKELSSYEVYTPYTLLSEIYRVIEDSGSYTSVTSVRISKNEFSLEGYTNSSLQLLDAFSKAGSFEEIELSAVQSVDDSKKPAPSMEGFHISGSRKHDFSNSKKEEPRA